MAGRRCCGTRTPPTRSPAPGEVLVSLRAASLNHLDLWVRKGLPSVPKPRILGADGAGVRVDTGERVVINPGLEHGAVITRDRGAHRRNALRDDRGPGRQRLPARRRDRLRDGGGVPARLRDGLPDARDEGAAPGRRMGADLGDRRGRRDRRLRDRPRRRGEDSRHVLVGREARARPRMGRRLAVPRGGGGGCEGDRRRRPRRRDGRRGDLEGLARARSSPAAG